MKEMNSTIDTILAHRSVRSFTDEKLSKEQIEMLVMAAQAASTSSFVQAYSIIGISDLEKKKALSELAGNQSYVANNGHFFVFCADLHRHQVVGEMEEADLITSIESTEKFMVSVIDTTLAAQNMAIAAESLGLGICYIGGIRNHLKGVDEVLKTPARVIPLFGMAVGYPNEETGVKPRLPLAHIYHENEYEQDPEVMRKELKDYNELISAYYHERTGGKRKDRWTAQMAKMLGNKSRMYIHDYIINKGLNKR
jgi:FMN reductase (NADPH)